MQRELGWTDTERLRELEAFHSELEMEGL
jgi:hypothetical protein